MAKEKEAKGVFPVGHPSTGKNLDGSPHEVKSTPKEKPKPED